MTEEIENKRGVKSGIDLLNSYDGVPEWVFLEIKRYALGDVGPGQPGSFVLACLRNDLHMAVNHADAEGLAALKRIMNLLYSQCPGECWGSTMCVARWRDPRGARWVSL